MKYTTDPCAIPFVKLTDVSSGACYYQCPDSLWHAHFRAWKTAYGLWKHGDKGTPMPPEPMPEGHLMFEKLTWYGCVPYGCSDTRLIRRAMRKRVIADLNGWDRELRQSAEGMRKLARIVRATVASRLAGNNAGAAPYLACLL